MERKAMRGWFANMTAEYQPDFLMSMRGYFGVNPILFSESLPWGI
jgi:hypothetical protein